MKYIEAYRMIKQASVIADIFDTVKRRVENYRKKYGIGPDEQKGDTQRMRYTGVLHKTASLIKTADPNRTVLNFQRDYNRNGLYRNSKPGLTAEQYAKIFRKAPRMSDGSIGFFWGPQQTTYNWARDENAYEQHWRDINNQWPNKLINGASAAVYKFIGRPLDGYVDKLLHRPIYADSPGSIRQKQTALSASSIKKI